MPRLIRQAGFFFAERLRGWRHTSMVYTWPPNGQSKVRPVYTFDEILQKPSMAFNMFRRP